MFFRGTSTLDLRRVNSLFRCVSRAGLYAEVELVISLSAGGSGRPTFTAVHAFVRGRLSYLALGLPPLQRHVSSFSNVATLCLRQFGISLKGRVVNFSIRTVRGVLSCG